MSKSACEPETGRPDPEFVRTVGAEVKALLGAEARTLRLAAAHARFLVALGLTQRDPAERAGLLRMAALDSLRLARVR